LIVASLAALAGCGPPVGDFGRPGRSVFYDEVVPAIDALVPGRLGNHGSGFELTADEIALRGRSYALIHPDDDEAWRRSYARSLSLLGYGVGDTLRRRRAEHIAGSAPYLVKHHPPEAAVLLARILTDTKLTRKFTAVAARVYEADYLRRRTLQRDVDFAGHDIHDTTARIAENRQIVADTILAIENRINDYRIDQTRSVLAHAHYKEGRIARAIDSLISAVRQLGRTVSGQPRARGAGPLTAPHHDLEG